MAEQADERFVQRIGRTERGVHQCGSDTGGVEGAVYADRPEGKYRIVPDGRPGQADMADDDAVDFGNDGQLRDPARIRPKLGNQAYFDRLRSVVCCEGARVNGSYRIDIRRQLASDQHGASIGQCGYEMWV